MKSVTTSEATTSSTGSTLRQREWISLVLPWAVIVLSAVLAAAVYNDNENTSPEEEDYLARQLYGDDGYVPPTDDYTPSSSSSSSSSLHPEHHHKPVYSEEHPPLFPLTGRDYAGFILAVMGLMVAAGGGIGGGGILVPIYILVMDFSPKHAIPLSNITVLGGAMANTILNMRKRHPLADRPLVDWDLILVMEPLTIAGALIGAFLNKILPELLLTVLLVLLLSFTAWNTLKKAIKMYRKETQMIRESELTRMVHEQDETEAEEAGDVLLDNMDQPVNDNVEGEQTAERVPESFEQKEALLAEQRRQEELATILEEERHTPIRNLKILVTLFIVVLTINLLKGGGAFRSPLGIRCGSNGFWFSNAAMLGWIVVISLFCRQYLIQRCERKELCGYKYVEGDIKWDRRATWVYPSVCCFAGFFAGMFGVGGGIVKGPLMLAMNVHPAVASASSACMILFTSFTATTSFVVFGLLVPDYAVICLLIGFFATLAGQIGLGYIMKKAQRNSYIAFSIGGVVLLSAFLMTIQSLLSMAEGEQHHSGGICGKGD